MKSLKYSRLPSNFSGRVILGGLYLLEFTALMVFSESAIISVILLIHGKEKNNVLNFMTGQTKAMRFLFLY